MDLARLNNDILAYAKKHPEVYKEKSASRAINHIQDLADAMKNNPDTSIWEKLDGLNWSPDDMASIVSFSKRIGSNSTAFTDLLSRKQGTIGVPKNDAAGTAQHAANFKATEDSGAWKEQIRLIRDAIDPTPTTGLTAEDLVRLIGTTVSAPKEGPQHLTIELVRDGVKQSPISVSNHSRLTFTSRMNVQTFLEQNKPQR
jgi:hypothetical protein